MFDVGRSYEVHYLEGDMEVAATCRVEEWREPLLRVSRPGSPDAIFNTTSQAFLRAIPQPLSTEDRTAKAHAHRPVEAAEMNVVAGGIA